MGDLSGDTSEEELMHAFSTRYPSVCGARIAVDPATGRGRGYGFVRFLDPAECARSLSEMQGFFLKHRAIRVAEAARKRVDDNSAAIAHAQALTAAHRVAMATKAVHEQTTGATAAPVAATNEQQGMVHAVARRETDLEQHLREPDWDPLAVLDVKKANDARLRWYRPMWF